MVANLLLLTSSGNASIIMIAIARISIVIVSPPGEISRLGDARLQ